MDKTQPPAPAPAPTAPRTPEEARLLREDAQAAAALAQAFRGPRKKSVG